MTANYFTAEKKAELKALLRTAFKARMVETLVDEFEAALTDVMGDEVVTVIQAQVATKLEEDGVLDAAIDSRVAVGALFEYAAPAAAAVEVLAATTLTEATQVVDDDSWTDPDVPRNLVLVPTMAGATLTGDVVITGTDIDDGAITETFALANDANVTGTKAFKTITQVDFPVRVTEADAVQIITGAKLGSPVLLPQDTIYLALVDGAQDTLPTITNEATDIEKCLIAPNTAPDGAKDFKFFYHA